MTNTTGWPVSIVIPNFNGEKLLTQNLPQIIKAKENSINNIKEIIIVDDASKDNSVALIKKEFPQIRLIKHTSNRGFSSAVNTGVRSAKGKLIVLLNTDVIPQANFLKNISGHFENDKIFAVSLHEDGYGPARGFFSDGYIELGMGKESDKPQKSFYVSGGSGVFRRDVWTSLGGMDEKLLSPFYWEDIDLCYRAAKRGYKLMWDPAGKVVHKHESTISNFSKKYVERIKERNRLLMLWKNITSPNLTRKHVFGLFKRLARHPGYIRIVIMAVSKFSLVKIKRKKEFKESRVSDEAVFAQYD